MKKLSFEILDAATEIPRRKKRSLYADLVDRFVAEAEVGKTAKVDLDGVRPITAHSQMADYIKRHQKPAQVFVRQGSLYLTRLEEGVSHG